MIEGVPPRPILLALALFAPAGGTAQVGPDTAAADTVPADTAIPLAPVRVTVLRAPILLSRSPYAVTVEREPSADPGLTLADALGAVPGLQVDNRFNYSQGDRISIRGLGARAQFGVRGVKVLVDGIPATLPDGQTSLSHLDPRWVERAEVLRGPASSLWGNAAGGVIQLATARPPVRGTALSASVLTGSHGLTHWSAAGGWARDDGAASPSPGAPASEASAPPRGAAAPTRLGLRAAVSRLLYDGFRDHAAADKRFATARAEWSRGRNALRVVAHAVSYEADNPGSLSEGLVEQDGTQAYPYNVAQETGEAADQVEVGVTWHRAADPGPDDAGRGRGLMRGRGLTVTGWALARTLDNPIPPMIIGLDRRAGGVRASGAGDASLAGRSVDWVVGLDAEGQWDDRRNWENQGGDRGALVLDQAERVASVAPFVELSAPVAGPLRAMAGLRYDVHRFTADDHLTTAGDPTSDDSGRRVMDQLSPSLGVLAELGPATVYANVASSFETPTTTELVNRPGGGAGFNPGLQPQRAWSVEAGVRTGLGGRARLQAAAYRTVVRDALIPFEVAGSPGRTFFQNAGSAVHRGLELDAWAEPTTGLTVRGSFTLVDARFDDFVTPDGDRSGNRIPGVAPHRATATVAWTGEAGGAGGTGGGSANAGGRLELEARWVDAIPVDDANTAAAPAYTLLGLRAASPVLPVAGARLSVFGGVDNFLDTEYVAAVTVNAFGGRYYEPGPGRSVYLGVRVYRAVPR